MQGVKDVGLCSSVENLCITFDSTVGPSCLQVSHPQIQPAVDLKHSYFGNAARIVVRKAKILFSVCG